MNNKFHKLDKKILEKLNLLKTSYSKKKLASLRAYLMRGYSFEEADDLVSQKYEN